MKDLISFIKKSPDKKIIRKFKDMKNFFSGKTSKNPLIYQVLRKKDSNLELSITIINPGKIKKENYMTKGHSHKKQSSEIIILTKGKGKVIEKKGNKIRKTKLKKNKIYLLEKGYAHRTVNTGKTKMEFLTIQTKNVKHNYKDFLKNGICSRN